MRLIDADALIEAIKGNAPEILGGYYNPDCEEEVEQIVAIVECADEFMDSDRWISVTDRLPERHKTSCPRGNNPDFSNVSETVWIYTQDGYTMEGTLEGDSWFDDMGQCLSDYFGDMNGHHVTHWMPLPEPPKEEEE